MWSSAEPHHNEEELHPQALYPWRNQGKGLVRVKRDWIIPPIRVLENSKQVPEDLVQVRNVKFQLFPLEFHRCEICGLNGTGKQVLLPVINPPAHTGQLKIPPKLSLIVSEERQKSTAIVLCPMVCFVVVGIGGISERDSFRQRDRN